MTPRFDPSGGLREHSFWISEGQARVSLLSDVAPPLKYQRCPDTTLNDKSIERWTRVQQITFPGAECTSAPQNKSWTENQVSEVQQWTQRQGQMVAVKVIQQPETQAIQLCRQPKTTLGPALPCRAQEWPDVLRGALREFICGCAYRAPKVS